MQKSAAIITSYRESKEWSYQDVAGVATRGFRQVRYLVYTCRADGTGVTGRIGNPGAGWVCEDPNFVIQFGQAVGLYNETWKLTSVWQEETPAVEIAAADWANLPPPPDPPEWS